MLTMLSQVPIGVDKYIVDIRRTEVIEVLAQGPINILLEGTGCVREPERGHKPLKKSIPRAERRFLLIPFLNPDLVEGGGDIKLSEPLGSSDLVEGLVNQREWIPVFPGNRVKRSVVHVKLEASSRFTYEQHGCGR